MFNVLTGIYHKTYQDISHTKEVSLTSDSQAKAIKQEHRKLVESKQCTIG